MCEILLCVRDMRNIAWPYPQQGDVIAVAPDGWRWGDCELGRPVEGNPNGNHPFWRIIKLPNVTVAQAANLLAPERDADPQHPSPYLQYRQFYFDKTKIPASQIALLQNLADDLRANGFVTLNFTAAQLTNVISRRPALSAVPS
jgi:hypothetical protein